MIDFTACPQAMVPLVASPLYGFLYKSTIDTIPGAFILFSAGIFILVAICIIIVHFGMKKINRKKEEEEELKEKKNLSGRVPRALENSSKFGENEKNWIPTQFFNGILVAAVKITGVLWHDSIWPHS